MLLLRNDFSIPKYLSRGHGQLHMYKNIFLFLDTQSYDDTCQSFRLLHQEQHVS